MSSNLTKKEWRAKARALVLEHAQAVGVEHVSRILNSPEFISSKVVALYFSVPTEPTTEPLFKAAFSAGKRVVVPVYDATTGLYNWGEYFSEDELIIARYGIVEPKAPQKINPHDINVCFLPGLLFDERGVRLGHGGGFYDRLLSQLDSTTPIIGIAFRWQIVEKLPFEDHDIICSKVIY